MKFVLGLCFGVIIGVFGIMLTRSPIIITILLTKLLQSWEFVLLLFCLLFRNNIQRCLTPRSIRHITEKSIDFINKAIHKQNKL